MSKFSNEFKEEALRLSDEIIRRFFPKGTNFKIVTIAKIKELEDWMNNYPRNILGGICSNLAIKQYIV